MNDGLELHIASTFMCAPMEPSLRRALVDVGIASGLSFFQFSQMSEYMFASATSSSEILGTVVLLRLEDWLHEPFRSAAYPAGQDAWMRQEFRQRVDQFVSQIAILSRFGNQVWFLACPSNGWLSEQHKLGGLCRTYTNLVVVRVRDLPQIELLNCPSFLSTANFADHEADHLGLGPFTQDGFNRLGGFLASEIARRAAGQDLARASSATSGSSELADYLAELQVRVKLVAADRSQREQVEHILRTAASFSLTGERPNISDREVDALLESGGCMLVYVTDRVSEYGPSGVVVTQVAEDALVVESMSLTCPVLGKQVEFAVLTALARIAAGRHLARVTLHYRPSERNQPILAFLKSTTDGQNGQTYVLQIDQAEARINKVAIAPRAWSLTIAGVESAR
jgi:hypothetical protein